MGEPHRNLLAENLKSRAVTPRGSAPMASFADLVPRTWTASTDLYTYIRERGFHFPREVVSRYLLSLKARPFVLFSGISGTGKSKLALLTAEYFAHSPGTKASRMERPADSESEFFLPIDKVTLRSGTLTPHQQQYDYFNIETGTSGTITINITNILGAQGDITFRATSMVYGGRKHLTVSVPVSVRRAFEQTGVQEGDYLRFEIVEEFKRYRVSLFRPERELVSEPPENRYAFVSVRPPWRDHTALLGFYDDELERYSRTPVLELLLRARREELEAAKLGRKPAPYFLVLDEMNIAKIEHYFSDFLSALETRRYDADGTLTQEPLHLHSADATRLTWCDEQGVEYEIPSRLEIPTNLLITGTVNDDESTYDLSPKVLDRTNTLEFNAVDFAAFLGLEEEGGQAPASPFELPEQVAMRVDLGVIELSSLDESQLWRDHLTPVLRINEALMPLNMHFGYRVVNDIARFLQVTATHIGTDEAVIDAALDIQVLQKILPKFSQLRDDRHSVLASLLYLCATGHLPERAPQRAELLEAFRLDGAESATCNLSQVEWSIGFGSMPEPGEVFIEAKFPRSAGRLVRLLSRLGG